MLCLQMLRWHAAVRNMMCCACPQEASWLALQKHTVRLHMFVSYHSSCTAEPHWAALYLLFWTGFLGQPSSMSALTALTLLCVCCGTHLPHCRVKLLCSNCLELIYAAQDAASLVLPVR
jgi:hypothetical protein